MARKKATTRQPHTPETRHHAVVIGTPSLPEHREQLVLRATFFHGDNRRNTTTHAVMASTRHDQDRLGGMADVIALYDAALAEQDASHLERAELPDRAGLHPDLDILEASPEGLPELSHDLRAMLPWDQSGLDMGDFVRAYLVSYTLTWYDAAGQAFAATLQKVF